MKVLKTLHNQPAAIKKGVELFLQHRMRSKTSDVMAGHRFISLHDFSMPPAVMRAKDIARWEAVWFEAFVTPCLFLAATKRDAQQNIEMAIAGHFSATVSYRDIKSALANFGSPEGVDVMLAGFGERSSHESLSESMVKVGTALLSFGLNYGVHFKKKDFPVVYDVESGRVVSDLGLNLNNSSSSDRFGRHVVFGVTPTSSILLSARAHMNPVPSKWLEVKAITPDKGVIEVDPEDYEA